MSPFKQYIGDAVYADFDGYHIVLTTEDGMHVSNRICLEPPVLASLNRYVKWLNECREQRPAAVADGASELSDDD